jgi:L-lactate dehydrogenase complex protein LldG
LHTALTVADWGIAATGSLVLNSISEDLRLATMLAETHVAVLPLSRLQPDSLALEDELQRLMASPPSYLAFITGASRTADIERVLTIGVHGPGELHILLLKDQES